MEFENQYGENTTQTSGSDAPIIIVIFLVLIITYIFSYIEN